jgi:hypothetical protein
MLFYSRDLIDSNFLLLWAVVGAMTTFMVMEAFAKLHEQFFLRILVGRVVELLL